ncbi:thioredoxin trx1 [Knufia fluminis]|uniref:Thioredoxin trx1 n=2 Tax=Knufia TaxID=430999 RepID=A0AAN8IQA9_9EURO|nr:thioredoxin trx1 [Knufia fluminis]
MGVHNLAEYVKYHQQKLRDEQARSSPTSTPSTPKSTPTKRKNNVNKLHSMTSYKTSVVEGSGDKIVVIDFFATWCGPCKVIAPAIVKMSDEEPYSEKVSFYKIDVDEAPDVAQELGIRAMPTFAIFKNGQKIDEVVGANERALRSKIDAAL